MILDGRETDGWVTNAGHPIERPSPISRRFVTKLTELFAHSVFRPRKSRVVAADADFTDVVNCYDDVSRF